MNKFDLRTDEDIAECKIYESYHKNETATEMFAEFSVGADVEISLYLNTIW